MKSSIIKTMFIVLLFFGILIIKNESHATSLPVVNIQGDLSRLTRDKNEEQFKEAGLGYLLRNVSKSVEIKESWNPFFCFNINLTKEIGDLLRVSFFANNMFRMYPRQEYKRSPGSYKTDLNNRHYFGVELGVKI